jgi:hypothetical protein
MGCTPRLADHQCHRSGYCGAVLLQIFYTVRSERLLMDPSGTGMLQP